MGNVISYNSWEDKAPFGAIPMNKAVRVGVQAREDYNINNIVWVLFKESNEVARVELARESKKYYNGEYNGFNEPGLYFYHFEVEVESQGNTYKVFYGKNIEDSTSCEYSYESINKYQITVYEDFEVPNWYKEGVMYNIFVDRFNNGNRTKKVNDPKPNSFIYANWSDSPMYIKDNNGDIIRWDFYGGNLKGIIDKLGYLKRLGVSIIYLSPIFEARSNHKYDTGNFKKIDPMFGDEEILSELVEKAKSKGINIILDGVFSHTGADSKYFNRYGTYEEKGAYQSEESEYSSWFNFTNFPNEYSSWWGVKDLPNVNELAESYRDYIIHSKDSVVNKWTNMGIKGWRLDVADELPTQFIREFKKQLKTADKDSVLVGEVWEDASNKISYEERRTYLQGRELDSIMGYPFRDNVLSFIKGYITSKQLSNKFMTIKENYPKESFKSNLNLIGSHDVSRVKTELNEDISKVKLAVALQMTFEGVPYIYYGDEAGLTGKDDPDNRKTYPWKNEDEDMVEFYRNAIGVRNKYKALSEGDTKFIDTKENDVFGFIRYNDDEVVLVLINRSEDTKNLQLDLAQNTLEEIDITYSSKRYLERFSKDGDVFNIDIDGKSCRIFNLLNLIEE